MRFFHSRNPFLIAFVCIMLGVATAQGKWFSDPKAPSVDTETLYMTLGGYHYQAFSQTTEFNLYRDGRWDGVIGEKKRDAAGLWRFNSYGHLCLDGLLEADVPGPCSTIETESDGSIHWRGMWFKKLEKV